MNEKEESDDEGDPDFRNFELSRSRRYVIYFVKTLGLSNSCGKKNKEILNKIDHANRSLDRDFNIKELVLHMKRNTEN